MWFYCLLKNHLFAVQFQLKIYNYICIYCFYKDLIKKVSPIIIIPVIIELNSNLSEESLWYLYLKNTNVTRKK